MKTVMVIVVALAMLVVLGCSSDSTGGGAQMPSSEAQAMTSSIATAVSAAMANTLSAARTVGAAKGAAPKATTPISYSGPGYVATGEYDVNTSSGVVSYYFDLTFNNYSYSDIRISSGTAIMQINAGSMDLSGVYQGNFTVIYKGASHSYSWVITMDFTGGTYAYQGVFYVDSFSYFFRA